MAAMIHYVDTILISETIESLSSTDSDYDMEMEIVVEPKTPEGYYSVESILGFEVNRDRSRKFKVKWDGYSEVTWEPEQNFDGCVSLLQEYLAKEGLSPTRIIAKAGASGGSPTNPLN